MDLPRVRRYRKGAMDRLYVEDAEGLTYGWADAATGDTTIQIPGSEARVDAAFAAWANAYPEDDLASHAPGRNTVALAAAWEAELEALDEDSRTLNDMYAQAIYQRDQYRKGNSGELRVGVLLNSLYDQGWGVLHSIPVYDGRSDIDHLLVGPGGVWTVNAKAHGHLAIHVNADRISVGRTFVEYIPAARNEAALVARILRRHGFQVPVHPAVALLVHDATPITFGAVPEGVVVTRAELLPGVIRASDPVLDASTIGAIFAVLRQRTTWETTA